MLNWLTKTVIPRQKYFLQYDIFQSLILSLCLILSQDTLKEFPFGSNRIRKTNHYLL